MQMSSSSGSMGGSATSLLGSSSGSTLLYDGHYQTGLIVSLANLEGYTPSSPFSPSTASASAMVLQSSPTPAAPSPSSSSTSSLALSTSSGSSASAAVTSKLDKEPLSISERHLLHKQRRQGLLDALTTRSLSLAKKSTPLANSYYFTIVTRDRALCLRAESEHERARWMRCAHERRLCDRVLDESTIHRVHVVAQQSLLVERAPIPYCKLLISMR
jgi:hypothetical protein